MATLSPTATPTDTPSPTTTPTPGTHRVATATAAVLATATAATAQATSTLPPPADRLSGRFVFPVFDGSRGAFDVYLAGVDGSGLRRLVAEASQPDLSPNGQQLVFRNWKNDQRGLATLNMDGSNYQRRTEFMEDGAVAWSADGSSLAFFSRREADRQPRIYLLDANSGRPAQALARDFTAVYGEAPSWMPGGRILYKATAPEAGLAIMNGDGSNFRLLLSDPGATAPAASPDGRFVAFMSQRDGNWEVYRLASDGTGLIRLTQDGAHDGLPVWAPDGLSIAFASNRGGSWAIWAMNTDGSNQRRLFALPGPLDARVPGEDDFVYRGWEEERIAWRP